MRLGEGRDVGIEVRITPREFLKSRQKLLIQHQAVTAGVSRDDGYSLVKCETQPFRISKRLVFPDETEFITDMTQEGQFPLSQRSVERDVLRISWIEMLGVGEDFNQNRLGIGTAMNFVDGIFTLRVDRGASQKHIWVSADGLEDVIIANKKVGVLAIEQARLVIESIHPEEHNFLHVPRGAQLHQKMLEVFLVGVPRMGRGELMFPQKKSKQRTTKEFR